jgi:predicted transposase/invertase (TIGR01784 family)
MKTGINPKVDCVFKAVFGAEENKDVLIHLLNAVLTPEPESRISHVEIQNPYNDAEFESGKQSIVDIKAKDEQGRAFQIEIQLLNTSGIRERMLWTWADIYHRQLKSGEPFKSLNPTISIWFLDKPLFKDAPEQFHHQFGILEKSRQELLSSQFDLQVIEMDKWKSSLKSKSSLDSWLNFLNYGEDLELENLPEELQVPEIKKAMKTLQRFSQSDKEHDLYMRRMEYLSVQASLEQDREEALKEREEALKAREEAVKERDAILKENEELRKALAEAKKAQK